MVSLGGITCSVWQGLSTIRGERGTRIINIGRIDVIFSRALNIKTNSLYFGQYTSNCEF